MPRSTTFNWIAVSIDAAENCTSLRNMTWTHLKLRFLEFNDLLIIRKVYPSTDTQRITLRRFCIRFSHFSSLAGFFYHHFWYGIALNANGNGCCHWNFDYHWIRFGNIRRLWNCSKRIYALCVSIVPVLRFSAPAIVVISIHAESLCTDASLRTCSYHVFFLLLHAISCNAALVELNVFACRICITITEHLLCSLQTLIVVYRIRMLYSSLIWNSDFGSASYHNLFRSFGLFVCSFVHLLLCDRVSASNNFTGEFITILSRFLSLSRILVQLLWYVCV